MFGFGLVGHIQVQRFVSPVGLCKGTTTVAGSLGSYCATVRMFGFGLVGHIQVQRFVSPVGLCKGTTTAAGSYVLTVQPYACSVFKVLIARIFSCTTLRLS
jgi:hypothetical protein